MKVDSFIVIVVEKVGLVVVCIDIECMVVYNLFNFFNDLFFCCFFGNDSFF